MRPEYGYDARAIANTFLDWAGEEGPAKRKTFNPIKAIKMVYIAHGWCLLKRGLPLIFEPILVWQYGPMIHSVYEAFKKYGGQAIEGHARWEALEMHHKAEKPADWIVREKIDEKDAELLSSVYLSYGSYSSHELSNITHRAGTPWHQAKANGDLVIDPEVIRAEYWRLQEFQNNKEKRANGS